MNLWVLSRGLSKGIETVAKIEAMGPVNLVAIEEHHELEVRADVAELLPTLLNHFDEPKRSSAQSPRINRRRRATQCQL